MPPVDDEPLRSGQGPGLLHHHSHLVPVEVYVQPQPHPAPRAHVGRHEEPIGFLLDELGLYPWSRLEPDCGTSVDGMLVEVAEGRALHDPEGRRSVVQAFLHTGQGEADLPEPVEQLCIERSAGWVVHGGADGNRTHDPLLAKQVL